ncbi:MAG TPA: ATPase, T2SS/T4P/T4SS family [Burkholderiales bacterium]|nr:ATPase, T2SS/T4P/T4SS family [Burkholderiales bacterium]
MYFRNLLLSDRVDRMGFDEAIVAELVLLSQLHARLFPGETRDPNDRFYGAAEEDWRIEPKLLRKVAGSTPVAPPPEPAPARAGWGEICDVEGLRRFLEAGGRHMLTAFPRDIRALGEILCEKNALTMDLLQQALAIQAQRRSEREVLGRILLDLGAVKPDDLTRALCLQFGVPIINLARFHIPRETLALIPEPVARARRALPVAAIGPVLLVAVDNPFEFPYRTHLAMLAGRQVELVFAPREDLLRRIQDYATAPPAVRPVAAPAQRQEPGLLQASAPPAVPAPAATAPRPPREDEAAIALAGRMADEALALGASDIRIEAAIAEGRGRMRFERDGRLEGYLEFPAAQREALVSRLKALAELDTAELRRAQQGTLLLPRTGAAPLSFRLATIPTIHGAEEVTLRLRPPRRLMPLHDLGMLARDLTPLASALGSPQGLIVVASPPEGGATTTLHALLRELNDGKRRIWTAEEQVDIVQPGIQQVPLSPKIGWTFPDALRTILHTRPDVVAVGSIAGEETARLAVEASGRHLVLAALRAVSAREAAARLLELGTDPFNLSGVVLAIVAQRVAQRLCGHCVRLRDFEQPELEEMAAEYLFSGQGRPAGFVEREELVLRWRAEMGKAGQLRRWEAAGCQECRGSGYQGKIGLFEVLRMTREVRGLLREQAPAEALERAAIAGGMRTLKQDGIEKVLLGLTDMRQVRAACL